jgi:hypothetical protein
MESRIESEQEEHKKLSAEVEVCDKGLSAAQKEFKVSCNLL